MSTALAGQPAPAPLLARTVPIADPGDLLRLLPGPSAVLAALAVSGLPTDRFTFEGFLPRKAGERSAHLAALAEERRLLYVGLTRAKRHLSVTWSGKPSRFLAELEVATMDVGRRDLHIGVLPRRDPGFER